MPAFAFVQQLRKCWHNNVIGLFITAMVKIANLTLDRERVNSLSVHETNKAWLSEQTLIDGNTNKGIGAARWVRWPGAGNSHHLGVSHLVVWVELAAVDVVVVTPEHSDQLSGVDGVHRHWAATWHKHKFWAAATRHRELQPFTALVGDLPVIYLRDKKWRHTRL